MPENYYVVPLAVSMVLECFYLFVCFILLFTIFPGLFSGEFVSLLLYDFQNISKVFT